jgi:AhpD family alkylhydroperoxidase
MPELNHPKYHQHLQSLMRKLSTALKGPMSGFAQLNARSMAEGVLSAKVKELMALSIAICVRCDGCIAYHVHDALKAGATRDEILETIGVAVMMGGGPATIYACEAIEALDQFETSLAEEKAASRILDCP